MPDNDPELSPADRREIDLSEVRKGADVFPAGDPEALQALMAAPGPLMSDSPEVPQASAEQAGGQEESN